MIKKSLLVLIFCMCNGVLAFCQTLESKEIVPVKGAELFPVAESGPFIYYCSILTPGDDNIKVTIQKFRTTTLELVESKDVFPRDFVPKEYVYNQASCDVKVIFKNGKFYFFYSLVHQKNYVLFSKVMNEDFSGEKNIEIGGFKENTEGKSEKFELAFSNDNLKAVFVLRKGYLRATKAIGGPMELYKHSEVYGYDLIADKVLFSKVVPDQVNDLQVKSDNFHIDNSGNVFFLVKLAEQKDTYDVLRELLIGLFENDKQDCILKKVDMTGFGNFIGKLQYLKNESMMFIAQSERKLKLSYIALSNPKSNFDKIVDFPASIESARDIRLRNIVVNDNNIYLTFSDNKGGLYNMYDMPFHIFAICLSFDGTIVWSKNVPVVMPLYAYTMGITGVNSALSGNTLLITYMENKPYEMTPKLQKAFDEDRVTGVVDNFKKFETVVASISADGKIVKKQVVNDQEEYFIDPDKNDFATKEGEIIFIVRPTKKTFKLKKISIK